MKIILGNILFAAACLAASSVQAATPVEAECLFQKIEQQYSSYLGGINAVTKYLPNPAVAYRLYPSGSAVGLDYAGQKLVYLDPATGLHDVGGYRTWLQNLNCAKTNPTFEKTTVNVVVGHFYFPEQGVSATPFSVEKSRALFEGDSKNIKRFFSDVSFSQVDLSIQYIEPIPLSKSQSQFQSEDPLGISMWRDALQLLDQRRPINNNDLVITFFPPLQYGYPGCQAIKNGFDIQVNNKLVSNMRAVYGAGNDFACYAKSITTHEIMHTFGAGHSSAVVCQDDSSTVINSADPLQCIDGSKGAYYAYSDRYDVSGGYAGHPNAKWKHRAGWIKDEQIIQSNRETIALLEPVDRASTGAKAIKIPLNSSSVSYQSEYWVEYRTEPSTRLEEIPGASFYYPTQNVHIRMHINQLTDQFAQVQTDLMLTAQPNFTEVMILNQTGQSYVDPYRKIKITWLGISQENGIPQAIIHVENLL